MKNILIALILMSLSLSGNLARAAEGEDMGTPQDAVAAPAAANGVDSDIKGSIAQPTPEQKENVAKPVKKAKVHKAKKSKAHASSHHAHSKKAKKKKAKRATSSEEVSGTTTAHAKKAKKKLKAKGTSAHHPHTPNT